MDRVDFFPLVLYTEDRLQKGGITYIRRGIGITREIDDTRLNIQWVVCQSHGTAEGEGQPARVEDLPRPVVDPDQNVRSVDIVFLKRSPFTPLKTPTFPSFSFWKKVSGSWKMDHQIHN